MSEHTPAERAPTIQVQKVSDGHWRIVEDGTWIRARCMFEQDANRIAAALRASAELDLRWAAASLFVRDIFDAVALPQPPVDGIVDLNKLALQVVGQIEDLKEDAETQRANCIIEDQLRSSAEALVATQGRQIQTLREALRAYEEPGPQKPRE